MSDAPEFAFNFFDPAVKADPYPLYAEMQRAGRVIANPFLLGQFMVAGWDDVRTLLHDPVTYCSGRLAGPLVDGVLPAPTMLNADPPDHERLRGTVARAFTPRSISRLAEHIDGIADELLVPLADGEPYDVVANLAERLPVLVIAELLGVDTSDLDDFVAWSHGLMGVLDVLAPPATARHAAECSGHLHAYFADEIERRRGLPAQDDLVGRLLAANDGGQLSDGEMLSACVLLLLGGNETTTKLITNGALALARHPGERARVAADPCLLEPAVEEMIRYDTPVQGNARIATRPSELAGVTIAEGSLVVGLFGAANRDPTMFEQPDRFDIGRDPNPHVGFGHGIHHCLGASLARVEARAAIGALLRAAPEYGLADDGENLEYGASFFFHAPTRLVIAG